MHKYRANKLAELVILFEQVHASASALHVSRQLHAHEHSTSEERHNHTEEPETGQHCTIELGHRRIVRQVQQDKTKPTKCEHEAGCQSFHDVLSVHTILHEGHRPTVASFVLHRANGRRFDNHIIDDATSDQEIREQHETEHDHR